MTVTEVLAEARKDQPFFLASGGGLTISGGEPMLQFEFTRQLLVNARAEGLHTCLETCGYGLAKQYVEIAPWVNLFLFDYKVTDPIRHLEFTGVAPATIRENLSALDAVGAQIILRCPIVPGVNDTEEHFAGIIDCANRLRHLQGIEVLRYHHLGADKARQIGNAMTFDGCADRAAEAVEQAMAAIRHKVSVPVKEA